MCVCAWLHDVESLGSQVEFAMFKRLRVNEAMEEKARRAMHGSTPKLSRKGRNKSRRQTTDGHTAGMQMDSSYKLTLTALET